jgi:hypothetical protein
VTTDCCAPVAARPGTGVELAVLDFSKVMNFHVSTLEMVYGKVTETRLQSSSVPSFRTKTLQHHNDKKQLDKAVSRKEAADILVPC